MYRLRKQTLPGMNQILSNHAEWLDYNVSKVAGDRCRKQAKKYVKIGHDPRQTRRKNERQSI